MDGWIDGRIEGRTKGWTDKRMEGWNPYFYTAFNQNKAYSSITIFLTSNQYSTYLVTIKSLKLKN